MKQSSSKRIAVVINTSWNIFNFRINLLKAFQDAGYEIVTIAPMDEYSSKLEEMGFEYHNIKINNKGTNPFEDAKLVYDFYKLYKSLKIDLILHYTIKPNIYGSIAANMLNIPVVNNISGLGTVFLNDGLSSKIAKFLYKLALKTPKKVFYQNLHDKNLFVELNLVKSELTGLLPGSGIDINTFKPSSRKISEKNKIKFLLIARLIKDKGIVEYVDAARVLKESYPESECLILGSYYSGNPTAIEEETIRKWEEEGLIEYLGTSNNVKEIIEQVDCIVLPSYREGLSRVLLEAASMSKPIITTNVPGCMEVVDDGINGYICKVKDHNSLANKMKKIVSLSDIELKEMGCKGREKIINEFDERIVIKKYMDEINKYL